MTSHTKDAVHLASCPDCQARATLEALDVDLDRVWSNVAEEVWAREVGWLERWLANLLGSPGLARALLTTPSLVLSWILASGVVLGVGTFFTYQSNVPWVGLLAPAVAGIGIAYSYGPGIDPTWELSKTTVVSDRAMFLARTVAVFAVNAVLGLAASLFSAQAFAVTFAWLVPMTTVSALALAAATWARSAPVGVGAGLMGWALAVVTLSDGLDDLGAAVSDLSLLPYYGMATAILAVVAFLGAGKRNEVTA